MPRAPEPDPPGIPELPPGLIGEASPRAGVAYLLLRLAWRAAAFLLRFRVEVSGLENLPRDRTGRLPGGWIPAGLPHRLLRTECSFLLESTGHPRPSPQRMRARMAPQRRPAP